MYFVTVKQEGYVLFTMTPSELGAVALTDDQKTVRLLRRDAIGDEWTPMVEWSVADLTHTDYLVSWHEKQEPAAPEGLLDAIPASVSTKSLR